MTDTEKLDLILSELLGMKFDMRNMKSEIQNMKTDILNMKDDISNMKTDILNMKDDIQNLKTEVRELKTHVSQIDSRLGRLEETVQKNYSLTEEFFVSQMETNTQFTENLRIINGRLDRYDTQIAKMPQQAINL